MKAIIHLLFTLYTTLLFIVVMGSWSTTFSQSRLMRLSKRFTNPYLQLFSRFIPPLGRFDLSPIIAFMALQFLEKILLSFVGGL